MKARLPALALALVLLSACDKKQETPAPAPSASAAESAKPLASAPPFASAFARDRMRAMRGGLAAMLLRGAKDLELKDDQKAKVEKLAADLHADRGDAGPMRTEAKDLHTELVAEIRAGKVDMAKLEPKLAAIENAAQAQKDKEADTLNTLHATLDAAQRKAVVANVRAARSHLRGPRGLWRHDRFDGGPGGDAGAADAGAKLEELIKRRAAMMTKELDLDDAQQKKLEAALTKDAPPPAAGKGPGGPGGPGDAAQMDAALDAFEKDAFDAKKLEGFATAGKTARAFAAHEAQLFADLLPALKPEQREKLAKHVEGGPGRGGPGFGPPGFGPPRGLASPMFDDDGE